MKKSLIGLAVLAVMSTSAMAQSTVTLSGNVKAGLASTKYSGGAAGTNGNGLALADGSSRFILSGSEDLGGGMRANFQVDTRYRIDDNGAAPTSSPLAGGNTFIGSRAALATCRLVSWTPTIAWVRTAMVFAQPLFRRPAAASWGS